MPRVLIVDDEANLRATLARTLRSEGYETDEARDGVQAVSRLQRGGIDVVLLDLAMPRLDGFGVLASLRDEQHAPPVIVLTAHASLDNAVRAVREGAWDFLEKPPSAEAILLRVRRALESAQRTTEVPLVPAADPLAAIIGETPAMRALKEAIARVAPTPARVLILGENGTGKELVARAIHELSPRAGGPLVRVNCAALPAELFEAELFGHVKGAFTGAVGSRRGRFERASGGTLFLDEIGEVPLSSQPKLLRALEVGEIERIGAESSTPIDVRVIAATNRDLPRLVTEGRFREDLYYRLEVVTLTVPPLRERREDIPSIGLCLLRQAFGELGRPVPEISKEALVLLSRQPWPGNVRQLRNLMERLAILATDEPLDVTTVGTQLGSPPLVGDEPGYAGRIAEAVASFERRFIEAAI
ncbi:MAG: sigma-54-dependent Fis family transcriptional regulator, partial [Acidobacteriota bacterium]